VTLEGATANGSEHNPYVVIIDGEQVLKYPIPREGATSPDKKIQELTSRELVAGQAEFNRLIRDERRRQAAAAALVDRRRADTTCRLARSAPGLRRAAALAAQGG